MVRNKKGGNRHKKMASKHNQPMGKHKLRQKKLNGEEYAQVQAILGNGMAHVLCEDNDQRLMVMRKKFKGRNKRDNIIKDGAIVLIGKRDWEVRMPNKKEKVDLLYVYSQSQIDDLKNEKSFKNTMFGAINELKKEEDNGIEFTNDDYDEFEDVNIVMNPIENQKLKETDINWDEI